ncbi:MAG: ABC transporter substrate-binding protein [Acidimicrobiales bacterium]
MPRSRRISALAAGLATVALVAAACGSSTKTTTSPTTAQSQAPSSGVPAGVNTYNASPSGAKVAGGTVYWAEAPNTAPNYIFPMTNAQVCGTNNIDYLNAMLYRPLYWYGNGNKATIDYNYSIGQQPVFSNNDQTVTVHLNNWKWSDGEQVTSQDVALWIGLYKANPSANYCGYVPPASSGEKFFPDNVVSVDTPNATTFVLHLTQAYNPTWFTYNELSQIYPLPMAWDATSLAQVGTNKSATVNINDTAGNEAVYNFLDAQSKALGTWATSPIWSIVDGPFKVSAFSATGEVDFVPNPSYSGSPKPTITKFVELPFTNNAAELTALKTNGTAGLTVGYLPPEDATQQSTLASEGYATQSAYTLSYNFFPLNLNNPTLGPTFQQLYFRQAFEHLVNQQGWITAFLNGWANVTDGPIPTQPPNPFSDSLESHDPYNFSVATAKQMLASHGWSVKPGGVTTCAKPGSGAGECGANVKAGTRLEFNLDYANTAVSTQSEMQQLASMASQVGIKLDLTQHDFNTVISTAVNCTPNQPKCSWTAENWGAGWVYAPDFYPSGESLFLTGAVANYENYNDPTANSLILKTTTAPAAQSQAALNAYQNYIINQVPVVFNPTELGNPLPGGPALISTKLGGVAPNAFAYITPETWYLTK